MIQHTLPVRDLSGTDPPQTRMTAGYCLDDLARLQSDPSYVRTI